MTGEVPDRPRERELRLRYTGHCRDCGTALAAGTMARWDPGRREIRCLNCPTAKPDPDEALDWGVAGASAQRQFDKLEGRRRERLRHRWVAVVLLSVLGGMAGVALAAVLSRPPTLFALLGAALAVLKLLATPQHIAAWRTGVAGEREVGARLEKLRKIGVLTVHDRRVPGRPTNIDHIAVSSAGVFVIDTKNVAGKVSLAQRGLRVAGRRRDEIVTGVQTQVEVVRQVLDDQSLPAGTIQGVLCFTRAELPWLRPAPGGVALLNPQGLSRTLRKPGPLTPDQVHQLAAVLARRLPSR